MKTDSKSMRDDKGRFKPGHERSRQPYKFLLSTRLKRQVASCKREVIRDLGGKENITMQKMLLLNKAMSLYGMSLILEGRLNIIGPVKGKIASPLLTEHTAIISMFRLLMKDIGLGPSQPRQRSPEELRALIAEKSKP